MTLVNLLILRPSLQLLFFPLAQVTVRGLSCTETKAPVALGSSWSGSRSACLLAFHDSVLAFPPAPGASAAFLSAFLGPPPVLRERQSQAHRVFLLSGIMLCADCCPESTSHHVTPSVH